MEGKRFEFEGEDGLLLAAEAWGDPAAAPVIFAHGGGQTRHSWRGTAERLNAQGWTAIAIDQRGHGDSDWIADGDYGFASFAADFAAVADQIDQRFGARPVGIGASLGGISALQGFWGHTG